MVLLHVKRKDQEFVLETTLDTSVEDTVSQAVELYNMQQRIRLLHGLGQQLTAKGLGQSQGGQQQQPAAETAAAGQSNSDMQPLVQLMEALDAAVQVVSNAQAGRRVALKLQTLQELVHGLRTALSPCCSAGVLLPGQEDKLQQLQQVLDSCTCEPGSAMHAAELDASSATLFFAGKPLQGGAPLRERLRGSNDRSKVVLKLQERGAGPPPREPQVDAEGERAMLQWWHRRQEEQRRAGRAGEEDADSDSAAWANPRALKQAFVGIGELKIR